MAESTSQHLKVFGEDTPEVIRPEIEGIDSLPPVLDAFAQATGWSLSYLPGLNHAQPLQAGDGACAGHVRLQPANPGSAEARVDVKTAGLLATAVGGMLGELLQARHALWRREAELAAGVPVVQDPEERQHLAARLQAVLKAGAEAVGAQAAALYMLDEATTELKLRSAWQLPPQRLIAPARPLQGALADLEALLGHAVVLEDAELMDHWRVPEEGFGAAVCVPVGTSTTILGTLWIFSNEKRDFSPQQTNILEVTAGRIAADLEREMLIREGVGGVQLKRRLTEAGRWQRNLLPSIPPLVDGWGVAGFSQQADDLGGNFHDWFCLDDGQLAVTVGDCRNQGMEVEAAMAATALRTALRCHARYRPDGDRLLDQANLTVWTNSAGDQFASVFFGLVDTERSLFRFSTAGDITVLLLRPDGWQSLSTATPPLGASPEASYVRRECRVRPGEALLIFTEAVRDAADGEGRPLGEAGLAEPLRARLELSAAELTSLARDRLEAHAAPPALRDHSVLVIKPTAP